MYFYLAFCMLFGILCELKGQIQAVKICLKLRCRHRRDDEWHKDNDGSKDRHDTGGTAPGGGPYPDMTFNEDMGREKKPAPGVSPLKFWH